jgi:hypothetical protein
MIGYKGEPCTNGAEIVQRFSAWRCGGFLAQKFNRITAAEPCTNVS